MKLASFQVCGHDDWILAGNPCNFGFDEWRNRCSGDRNIYGSASNKIRGSSYCSDCYAAQVELIRAKFTKQSLAVFEDARARSLPGVAIKRLMESLEEEMQEKIDEWRTTCPREPVLDRNELKIFLRSKVDWFSFVLLKMRKEDSRDLGIQEHKLTRAQDREKKMYQDWKPKADY